MGKDLHNDNFEDFFRKHLNNFDDEPADDMWERIEPVIPPKPEIAWSAYALPSALILSVALLVFVGFKMFEYKKTSENLIEQLEESNREIESMNDDLIIQKEENVLLNTDFNYSNNENPNESNSVINKNDITAISKRKKQSIINNQNSSNSTNNSFTKTTNSAIFNSMKMNQNYEQTIGESKEETLQLEKQVFPIVPEVGKEFIRNNPETTSNTGKPMAITNKANLNLLAMKSSSIMTKNNWQINKVVTVDKPLIKEILENKNSITLFVAPTILKNNIHPPRPSSGNNPPPPPNNPRPIPTEKVKLGQSVGIKYGRNLSDKLTLSISGIYANTSYDFNTRHFLPYNKDTEQDISTDKAGNTIDYSGSSTYGEYSVDADVTRLKDNGVVQNEEIDVKIDATAQIHSVIIPAYLTYDLFEVKGFSIGLKGGLSYNNVIKNDLKINSFKVQKQGFEVQDVRLKERPKPSKKGVINTLSGVVLAYDFQDNWSFVVEPTWSSALSDNHESDFGRTKSNMFTVDIGLKYSF